MLLFSFKSLNGANSASRRATEVQKKGKSLEFNPRYYEKVKSSPSLKVWSHKSVKDTVKLLQNTSGSLGTFQVTGRKLSFTRSNRHDEPGEPMKSTQTLEIVLQISCQSLKKGHREGKNIPPGQIPLYNAAFPLLKIVEMPLI